MVNILYSVKKQNEEDLMWSYPLNTFRAVAYLKKHDYHLNFGIINNKNQNECDVAFVDSRFLTLDILDNQRKPLIVYDQTDFSSCYNGNWGNIRDFIHSDSVKFVCKNSVYTNLELHNHPTFEGTVHGKFCLDSAIACGDKPNRYYELENHKKIDDNHIVKMNVLSHYLWSDIIEKSLMPNLDLSSLDNMHRRPIDILLLGSGSHYLCWHVRWHRSKAADAMRKLPNEIIRCLGLSSDSKLPKYRSKINWPNPPEFFNLAKNSKIMLSPWGYGELSTRDYEAIICGNIIIKPKLLNKTLEISTFPEIYLAGNIVYCKPDFSDLEDRVYEILNSYDAYANQAVLSANKLLEIYNKKDQPFINLLQIFKKLNNENIMKYL
jgi:hypothetical protein